MDAPSGGKLVEFSVSILYDGNNACRGEQDASNRKRSVKDHVEAKRSSRTHCIYGKIL